MVLEGGRAIGDANDGHFGMRMVPVQRKSFNELCEAQQVSGQCTAFDSCDGNNGPS